MAEAEEEECQVEEAFLLKVLRDLVNCRILQASGTAGENEEDLDTRLEALWDLCVDAKTADALVALKGISILAQASEKVAHEGRQAEVCIGIVANVCSHWAVAKPMSPEDAELVISTALRALFSQDGLVVLQALRAACALLCDPSNQARTPFWTEDAVERYLFVLQNSLRLDAVRHACDALSQGLVLEARQAEEETEEAADEGSKPFSALPLLTSRARLSTVLAQRSEELITAVQENEEISEGDGDPEMALLSALCLAESFLAVAGSGSRQEVATLCCASLRALEGAGKPEVLTAALEVLGSLLEADAQADANGGGGAAAEEEGLQAQVKTVASSAPGIAEKLALLLADFDEDSSQSAVLAALVLLQHAPRGEVVQQLEVIAAASRWVEAEDAMTVAVSADFWGLLRGGS